jgi:hypothetical protein
MATDLANKGGRHPFVPSSIYGLRPFGIVSTDDSRVLVATVNGICSMIWSSWPQIMLPKKS